MLPNTYPSWNSFCLMDCFSQLTFWTFFSFVHKIYFQNVILEYIVVSSNCGILYVIRKIMIEQINLTLIIIKKNCHVLKIIAYNYGSMEISLLRMMTFSVSPQDKTSSGFPGRRLHPLRLLFSSWVCLDFVVFSLRIWFSPMIVAHASLCLSVC